MLNAYRGRIVSRDQLAREACEIEIDILGRPIGRQDQYAAAFGGMNYIRFNPDDSVNVEPVPLQADAQAELESRTLLVYTDKQRDAGAILEKQSLGTHERMNVLTEMRDLADAMRTALTGDADLDQFARLLHTGWQLKRSLGFGISDAQIDQAYEAALRAARKAASCWAPAGEDSCCWSRRAAPCRDSRGPRSSARAEVRHRTGRQPDRIHQRVPVANEATRPDMGWHALRNEGRGGPAPLAVLAQ